MTVIGLSVGGPEVTGVIALGAGSGMADPSATWWRLQTEEGVIVDVMNVGTDAPVLRPTVESIDVIGSPRADTVLLRVVATTSGWRVLAEGGLVAAIDAKLIEADGDEAIFIRYLGNLTAVLRSAAETLFD